MSSGLLFLFVASNHRDRRKKDFLLSFDLYPLFLSCAEGKSKLKNYLSPPPIFFVIGNERERKKGKIILLLAAARTSSSKLLLHCLSQLLCSLSQSIYLFFSPSLFLSRSFFLSLLFPQSFLVIKASAANGLSLSLTP